MDKALLLLSGGQDSTTALAWAQHNFSEVETLSFDFGQTHKIELKSAKKIAEICNVKNTTLDITDNFSQIQKCSLLECAKSEKASEKFPATFVPGRNLLFLTLASIIAYPKGIRDIIIGVSQVDYSGYPDCREDFVHSAEKTISLAMDEKFRIHAPFLHMSKADEIRMMQNLGEIELYQHTHTCYRGKRPPCKECDACTLRAEAFTEVGIEDPIFEKN